MEDLYNENERYLTCFNEVVFTKEKSVPCNRPTPTLAA